MQNRNIDKVLIFSLIKPLLLMGVLLWLGQSQSGTSQIKAKENLDKSIALKMTKKHVLAKSKKLILESHYRQEDFKKVIPLIHPRGKNRYITDLSFSGSLLNKCIDMHLKLEKSMTDWKPLWERLEKTLANLNHTQAFIASKLEARVAPTRKLSVAQGFGNRKI